MHRQSLPALRRHQSGRRDAQRTGLATLLAPLGAAGRLRHAGDHGIHVDVPPQLDPLRRPARAGCDAHHLPSGGATAWMDMAARRAGDPAAAHRATASIRRSGIELDWPCHAQAKNTGLRTGFPLAGGAAVGIGGGPVAAAALARTAEHALAEGAEADGVARSLVAGRSASTCCTSRCSSAPSWVPARWTGGKWI